MTDIDTTQMANRETYQMENKDTSLMTNTDVPQNAQIPKRRNKGITEMTISNTDKPKTNLRWQIQTQLEWLPQTNL